MCNLRFRAPLHWVRRPGLIITWSPLTMAVISPAIWAARGPWSGAVVIFVTQTQYPGVGGHRSRRSTGFVVPIAGLLRGVVPTAVGPRHHHNDLGRPGKAAVRRSRRGDGSTMAVGFSIGITGVGGNPISQPFCCGRASESHSRPTASSSSIVRSEGFETRGTVIAWQEHSC